MLSLRLQHWINTYQIRDNFKKRIFKLINITVWFLKLQYSMPHVNKCYKDVINTVTDVIFNSPNLQYYFKIFIRVKDISFFSVRHHLFIYPTIESIACKTFAYLYKYMSVFYDRIKWCNENISRIEYNWCI